MILDPACPKCGEVHAGANHPILAMRRRLLQMAVESFDKRTRDLPSDSQLQEIFGIKEGAGSPSSEQTTLYDQ